jgi:sugar (pentulose or hexulose) kinase
MSLLGLDIGTTGCKAASFSVDGKLLHSNYEEYPLHFPAPNRCELDPAQVWEAISKVILSTAGEVKSVDPVEAIGISALADAITPVDAQKTCLGPSVVGSSDRRAIPQAEWIAHRIGREKIFELTGVPLHPMYIVPKMMWFRDNMPEMYHRTWRFLGWPELVHQHLGLDPVMDYSMGGRSMAVSVCDKEWNQRLLDEYGLDGSKLSPLASSHRVIGTIDARYASPLGLEPGVAVVTGGFDQSCAALGAGVVHAGIAALTIGTCEVATVISSECRLDPQLLWGNHGCNLHALDGQYLSLAIIVTGGSVLRWYRDTLGYLESKQAEAEGIDPYEAIISSIPPGPSSIFVLPYFAGTGTPLLDVKQKGSIFGLSLDTDRPQIVKGILDSLCYELRLNVESMRSAGLSIDAFRAMGGGSKSDTWMQLKADITRIPIEVTEVGESGCLGAAFLAGLGIGTYSSADDIRHLAGVKKTFEPRNHISTRYDESYEKYKELVSHVKGIEFL